MLDAVRLLAKLGDKRNKTVHPPLRTDREGSLSPELFLAPIDEQYGMAGVEFPALLTALLTGYCESHGVVQAWNALSVPDLNDALLIRAVALTILTLDQDEPADRPPSLYMDHKPFASKQPYVVASRPLVSRIERFRQAITSPSIAVHLAYRTAYRFGCLAETISFGAGVLDTDQQKLLGLEFIRESPPFEQGTIIPWQLPLSIQSKPTYQHTFLSPFEQATTEKIGSSLTFKLSAGQA